ncbi:MAG: FAD:protein FMN transferase [Bdellovibrionales bacterium]|nr:FAD:protein FMN transferase [Bdellovibrionales bacterium]
MGTIASIRVFEENPEIQGSFDEPMKRAFSVMENLDSLLSTYKENSQVSQLNRQGYLNHADPDLIDLIEKSRQIERVTKGAFDITLAALTMKTYHFEDLNQLSSSELLIPDPHEIRKALKKTGSFFVQVRGQTIRIKKSGLGLDFGGIAKGYAVDKASQLLQSEGLARGSVALSGDIRCFGECLIRVRNPLVAGEAIAEFHLRGAQLGVSTSGAYGRYAGNPKFHHLLDPQTGGSVSHFSSVTLAGPYSNCELDAWATALSVMPAANVKEFLKSHNELAFLLVYPDLKVETNFDSQNWISQFRILNR